MSSDTLFSGSMPYGPFWNSVQAFIGSILVCFSSFHVIVSLLTSMNSWRCFFMVRSFVVLILKLINLLQSIGIYSVLSMIWVYVILQQRHKIHWIFRVLGLAMYMVASTDLGFTIWLLFEKLLKGKGPYQYTTLKYFLYVINKYVFLPSFSAYCKAMSDKFIQVRWQIFYCSTDVTSSGIVINAC